MKWWSGFQTEKLISCPGYVGKCVVWGVLSCLVLTSHFNWRHMELEAPWIMHNYLGSWHGKQTSEKVLFFLGKGCLDSSGLLQMSTSWSPETDCDYAISHGQRDFEDVIRWDLWGGGMTLGYLDRLSATRRWEGEGWEEEEERPNGGSRVKN